MASLVRALVVLLIAVVAAWSVAQASSTTTMALDMAARTAHHAASVETVHCHHCGAGGASDEAGLLCQIGCVAPALADLVVSFEPGVALAASALRDVPPTPDLRGRSDPPEPFPPRLLVLT
ncbi:hypothetical protein [Rubellimicrobium aerolatum]|uniref:DUF2946 domain-containing protein n=1 Tax=Rubellimicrobium aerolatum TaxID=490979 RepID=A0ABW0SE83_9RHOB|nr:hypothetical protein [Rubellimicrobium aerolatum]MBP1807026.1 hypothetical protein [Rubellimicrobium aerolatum]